VTTQYEEFIGKEPSLNQLYDFITSNKKEFDEYNDECIKEDRKCEQVDYSVIFEYIKFAKEYGGHYYIGGNIKKYPNDPIKQEYILKATKLNNEAQPQHMMEVSSQIRCTKQLMDLEKILEIYYEKLLEEYYAPPDINSEGGEGYKKVADETMIGKENPKL
jgi:hypothetical protein